MSLKYERSSLQRVLQRWSQKTLSGALTRWVDVTREARRLRNAACKVQTFRAKREQLNRV